MSTPTQSDTTTTPETPTERCGQCGAPAAPEQRYCVNCGFHRRNAPDPVSRYLSEASVARARVAAATALAAQRGPARRVGLRAVALLAGLALLVGILIGSALGGGSTPARGPRHTTPSAPTQTSTGTVKQSAGAPKLRQATGSSYLQQEQNLPNSVTP